MTAKLQAHAHAWRSIVRLSDEQVADMIREDRIDILVDLAGHSADNRLLVFARKPAPVQVNYQGYPATTGLTAIDYRLTDILSDPPGLNEPYYSEQLIRLPRTDWCFHPSEDAPAVTALPAIRNGHVTFGSFNNLAKVNEPLLKLWAEILRSLPTSRLSLKARGLASMSAQDMVRQVMSKHGVAPDRLDFSGQVPWAEHLPRYNQIDIALDTYPYHGTTTTCEAMWMGVPVVTLAGPIHVARVGVSLLTNVGLPELIAQSPEQYVQIAIGLAGDLVRLAAVRRSLRDRMLASCLTDGESLARDIENAYRTMWQTWCAG
jgi:predicted O-linked N-acetylglucosamine transferase (SPINDLY family)